MNPQESATDRELDQFYGTTDEDKERHEMEAWRAGQTVVGALNYIKQVDFTEAVALSILINLRDKLQESNFSHTKPAVETIEFLDNAIDVMDI